ncbi:MAG: prolipoprotein diacylglyceryl transferase [Chlamydiae bacterium RIFCSPHIGHO2_12_FULL_49_9]|nr:MAG: prolipoprotein diacylglyceryl transferase [Chlamydiae bacterium RIFCSPHIGHO2_12_FULL_49_9]
MIGVIYWDPRPEIFVLPIVNWPILWYGVFFTLGFALGFPIFVGVLSRFFKLMGSVPSDQIRKTAVQITDRLVVYMIVATVVGARVGHFLFYERPASYFKDPWEIFRIWEGGLASHGAVVAILIAVFIFSMRIRKTAKGLSWVRLLDFVSIPTAMVAAWIRLGNFFNQEILGTKTDVPWAVVFGHPADHSRPAARHPAQIYEMLFYLAVFFLLWRLSYRSKFLMSQGKLIGTFLILVFGFRFVIEFLKLEQSHLVSAQSALTMGQYLSLPVVALGLLFYFWKRPK